MNFGKNVIIFMFGINVGILIASEPIFQGIVEETIILDLVLGFLLPILGFLLHSLFFGYLKHEQPFNRETRLSLMIISVIWVSIHFTFVFFILASFSSSMIIETLFFSGVSIIGFVVLLHDYKKNGRLRSSDDANEKETYLYLLLYIVFVPMIPYLLLLLVLELTITTLIFSSVLGAILSSLILKNKDYSRMRFSRHYLLFFSTIFIAINLLFSLYLSLVGVIVQRSLAVLLGIMLGMVLPGLFISLNEDDSGTKAMERIITASYWMQVVLLVGAVLYVGAVVILQWVLLSISAHDKVGSFLQFLLLIALALISVKKLLRKPERGTRPIFWPFIRMALFTVIWYQVIHEIDLVLILTVLHGVFEAVRLSFFLVTPSTLFEKMTAGLNTCSQVGFPWMFLGTFLGVITWLIVLQGLDSSIVFLLMGLPLIYLFLAEFHLITTVRGNTIAVE